MPNNINNSQTLGKENEGSKNKYDENNRLISKRWKINDNSTYGQ